MSLKTLFDDGLISMEDALKASDAPDDLRLMLRGVVKGTARSVVGGY